MILETSGPALGVDVGGTKILGLIVDETGQVLARSLASTPHPELPDGGIALSIALAEIIGRLHQGFGLTVGEIPIGIGLPGMMDHSGVLLFAPNLRSASGLDVAGTLSERLGDVRVVAGNDADCAALAEQRLGAAKGHDDVIAVTLGTGIGGGIVTGGRLLRGGRGFAGEIGHMVIDVAGPVCPCGARGCWERYASGSAVGRMARDAAHAGHLETLVAKLGGDAEAVRGEDVTAAALEGDPECLVLLDEVGWWLARGLANLVAVLDPTCIVIGGGLSDAAGLLVPSARRHLMGLVEAGEGRPAIDVVAATLGPEAGAVGASLLARGS